MTPRRVLNRARPRDPFTYNELPGSFMLKIGKRWMDIRRNIWLEWDEKKDRWESVGAIFDQGPHVLILEEPSPRRRPMLKA